MARMFRPTTPTNSGAAAIKEVEKQAKAIVDKAQRTAAAVERGASRREREIDKKVAIVHNLLPNGFTPAPNLELLPPSIREKAMAPGQEVLDAVDGRTLFIPTPAQRQMVFDYAKFGVPLGDIRLRVLSPQTGRPVSTDVLKKYFAEELSLGAAERNIGIAGAAYRLATFTPAEYDDTGKEIKPEQAPNPSVLIAAAKHHLGWMSKKDVTVTHNMGVDAGLADALKELTDDELRVLRRIASQRADAKSESGAEGD